MEVLDADIIVQQNGNMGGSSMVEKQVMVYVACMKLDRLGWALSVWCWTVERTEQEGQHGWLQAAAQKLVEWDGLKGKEMGFKPICAVLRGV